MTTVTDRFSSSSYGHGVRSVTAAAPQAQRPGCPEWAGPAGAAAGGSASVPALCSGQRVLPVGWCDSDIDSADTDIDPILKIGPGPAVCGPSRD